MPRLQVFLKYFWRDMAETQAWSLLWSAGRSFLWLKKNENNVANNSIRKNIYANMAYAPWEQSLNYTGNRAFMSQIKLC